VIKGCGVIQGDAVTYPRLQAILTAVKQAGFSAQNVAFGMGGALLQVNTVSIVFVISFFLLDHSMKYTVSCGFGLLRIYCNLNHILYT